MGEKKIKIALMLEPHEAGARQTSCQPTANFLFKALAELIEGLTDLILSVCQTLHLHSDVIRQVIVLKYFLMEAAMLKTHPTDSNNRFLFVTSDRRL